MIDTLLWLLLTDLKRPQFLADSAAFGKEWIMETVQRPQVVSAAAKLCKETFTRNDEVIQKAADLCCWYVKQPKVQELATSMMQATCLRDDTYDVMMWQVRVGMEDALCSYESRTLI